MVSARVRPRLDMLKHKYRVTVYTYTTEVYILFANAHAARDTHVDGRGTQITDVERDNIEGWCLHDIRA